MSGTGEQNVAPVPTPDAYGVTIRTTFGAVPSYLSGSHYAAAARLPGARRLPGLGFVWLFSLAAAFVAPLGAVAIVLAARALRAHRPRAALGLATAVAATIAGVVIPTVVLPA